MLKYKSEIGGILYGVLCGLVMAIAFFSCSKYTTQKAIADVNKANDNYPAPVAEWLRGKYPCITKASDTVILTKDSVIYIECPDLPEIIHMPGDTIYNTVVKTVKVPVTLPVRTQVVTKYIEDSAKIKVMQNGIDELTKKANELTAVTVKLKGRYVDMKESRNDWRWRSWLTWLALAIYIILRVAKKVKPTSLLKWII